MTDYIVIQPGSAQWQAWREYLQAKGGMDEIVARLDLAAAAGKAIRVPKEWPTDEAQQNAAAAAAAGQARKAYAPLSDGAQWLGLYNSVDEPLIDARSTLVKAGMRPSDTLLAVTTREAELPFRETRWKAEDFLRKAPALRAGQHVTVEWQRGTEMKVAVAIAYGMLLGKPEALQENDVVPFMKAHPLTRKALVKWWIERTTGADEREADAALKSMNARELQNATLLMDNEAASPMGNHHLVEHNPFSPLWKPGR
jgi:hypothetical protein